MHAGEVSLELESSLSSPCAPVPKLDWGKVVSSELPATD